MASPRPLVPFVSTLAVAGLVVAGVLVGTAPVSAAPARAADCVAAFDALEEEFGDVDLAVDDDLQSRLDALLVAYDEQSQVLYEQLETLAVAFDDLLTAEDAALEGVEAAATARDDAQAALDAAGVALGLAEIALATAVAGGDADAIIAAQGLRDLAASAQTSAQGDLDDATTGLSGAESVLAGVQEQATAAEAEMGEVSRRLDDLGTQFEADFEALVGDVPEVDLDRLLQLLVAVALGCNGPGGSVTDAPVAQPVSARASFAG